MSAPAKRLCSACKRELGQNNASGRCNMCTNNSRAFALERDTAAPKRCRCGAAIQRNNRSGLCSMCKLKAGVR